jgi:hypothetical protein
MVMNSLDSQRDRNFFSFPFTNDLCYGDEILFSSTT